MIIAVSLSALIGPEPWKRAHESWFREMGDRLDKGVLDWIPRKDYFKGVEIVMQRLFPELTEKERTIEARRIYFGKVIENVKQDPPKGYIEDFRRMEGHTRAVITTNTQDAWKTLENILGLGFFELVETSMDYEKDDKLSVFRRFVEKHGKPDAYIGADREDVDQYCRSNGIRFMDSADTSAVRKFIYAI